MSTRRGSRLRSPLLLVALCAVLAAILYEEVKHPFGPAVPADAKAPVSLPPLPPEPQFAMPPESSFAAERPLFSATRRPSQSAGASKDSLAESTDFTLIGVVISGAERYAVVRSTSGDGFHRLNEGDALAGWSALSIGPDRVLFRQGIMHKEAVLDYKAAPPGPPRKKRKLANASAQPQQAPVPTPQEPVQPASYAAPSSPQGTGQ
jgi:hypothetical protein